MRQVLFILLFIGYGLSVSAQRYEYSALTHLLRVESAGVSSTTFDIIDAERSVAMRDIGLYASASYSRRSSGGIFDLNDPLTQGRAYYNVGLDWEILKNGWYEQRNKAYQKNIEYQLATLSQFENERQEAYYIQFALLAYIFERNKAQLYIEREQELRLHIKQAEVLFKQAYIKKEDVLTLNSRLNEVELVSTNLNNSIHAFEEVFTTYASMYGPLMGLSEHAIPSINIGAFLKKIDEDSNLKHINTLKGQLLERSTNWKNDVRFTASVDYNQQVSFDGVRRDFSSVRLAVRVPIRAMNRASRRLRNAQLSGFSEELDYELLNRKKEAITLHKEYVYKQKQIQNAHQTKQLLIERIRVQKLLMNSVDSSLEGEYGILTQDDVYAVESELLDLKHQLYKLLLKLNMLLPNGSIEEVLYQEDIFNSEKPESTVIVDATEVTQRSPELYAQFFDAYDVDIVCIKAAYTSDFEPYVKELNKRLIPTYLLINQDNLQYSYIKPTYDYIQSKGLSGLAINVDKTHRPEEQLKLQEALQSLSRHGINIYVASNTYDVDSWIDETFELKGESW